MESLIGILLGAFAGMTAMVTIQLAKDPDADALDLSYKLSKIIEEKDKTIKELKEAINGLNKENTQLIKELIERDQEE